MVVITDITTGQIATLINAGITIVQATLGLALVVVLVHTMNNANSAISWSVVTRILHSSFWPTILRTDSAVSSADARVQMVTVLTFLGAILLAAAGIITPLGVKDGPIILSKPTLMNASYIADTSPIGLATPPRDLYTYGRICGAFVPVPCPRNGDNGNTTVIAPSIIETFSSTSHGPFNMQFRRYYQGMAGYGYHATTADITLVQSFILRNDIFAIEGLIVDFTDNPGIGLWNHTFPSLDKGGTWDEDVLWFEPVTACVDTNVTIDYKVDNDRDMNAFNLTDQGGIANLTTEYPEYSLDGQHIDIQAHAYKGAVMSKALLMHKLNITRNESYVGRKIPLNRTETKIQVGKVQFPMTFLTEPTEGVSSDILCQGYGGADTINISSVAVHCFMILGPPVRTDGGDRRFNGPNTTWTQNLHYCAATTRVRMQTITFSFNGTSQLQDLQMSRKNIDSQFLWAMEKTGINISDIDPFWGRVTDSYENDPELWTTRSDVFYVPAGASDLLGVIGAGQPTTVIGAVWNNVYQPNRDGIDYSGTNDFALLTKWQSTMQSDPVHGSSRMSNWIWTDLMANNLMGNATSATVTASIKHATVAYDYKYAIPAFILLALWAPTFLAAICILLVGAVKLKTLRYLLNQTSAGRLAVGDSALVVIEHPGQVPPGNSVQFSTPGAYMRVPFAERGLHTNTSHLPTSLWSNTAGQKVIGLVPAAEGHELL